MSTNRVYRIAVIPDDGIGKEVVLEGVRVLEGEYSAIGGRMFKGTPREVVVQETVMSRFGVDRVLKFAFELAQKTPKKQPLSSAARGAGRARNDDRSSPES